MTDDDTLGARVRRHDGPTKTHFLDAYEGAAPPWDIGRPQRDLVDAFDRLAPRGRAIDLGCGTGEHVLELSRRGLEAWGLDSTPAAIDGARAKADARGLTARWVLGDALDLLSLRQRFDLVLDCGLYHVIGPDERRRYVDEVRQVLVPGGLHLMLGFSTNLTGSGPRGYSEAELREAFAEGFTVRELEAASYEVNIPPGERPAWLSVIERLG